MKKKQYKVGEIHRGAYSELNIIVSDTGEHNSYFLDGNQGFAPTRVKLENFPSALLSNNENSKVINETR